MLRKDARQDLRLIRPYQRVRLIHLFVRLSRVVVCYVLLAATGLENVFDYLEERLIGGGSLDYL